MSYKHSKAGFDSLTQYQGKSMKKRAISSEQMTTMAKLFGATDEEAAQIKSAAEHQDVATCSWCKKPITGFKDEISKREHGITGMCQECQDRAFADE